MTDIQLVHFSFGGDSREDSRFYAVALREARVATDAHAEETPAPRRGLLDRLGLALRGRGLALATGGATKTDACACAA